MLAPSQRKSDILAPGVVRPVRPPLATDLRTAQVTGIHAGRVGSGKELKFMGRVGRFRLPAKP